VKSEERARETGSREGRERGRERRGHNTITCGVDAGPCSLSVRRNGGMRAGDCGEGAPMVGGKIEYESLMRAISAPLPRPSATHSQTSRLSGCPSCPYLSLHRECALTTAAASNGKWHFESLMSRSNPQIACDPHLRLDCRPS